MEPLGVVMTQLVSGGGAAKLNLDALTRQLAELGDKYPFQVGMGRSWARGFGR